MAHIYKVVNLTGGGSGSGGSNPSHVALFDATTSWSGPSGGEYSISISEVVHGQGASPQVQVFEKNGTDYEEVVVFITVNASGDVTIKVPDTPDLRFEGKLIIGE